MGLKVASGSSRISRVTVSPRSRIVSDGGPRYINPMAIWIIFAAMAGAAVMAVLWPLSRKPAVDLGRDPETQFYREQLAEIDRDVARGLLSASEAEGARTEAARRLLRTPQAGSAADVFGEPALRRRRAASAIALCAVPLLALAVYGAYGSPQLPAQAFSARIQDNPQQ